MDFSKMKSLFIPEGKVKSLSIGGKAVWQEQAEETPGVPFTTNVPKLEFSPYEYGTSYFPFYGTGQVVLSGGTGKYSVSDSAITAIGGVTTSLVDGVYTMHIDTQDGYGIGGTFYIYFSDGVTTIEFPVVIEYCVCLTGDALITLADGTQKRIDQLTFDDKILAVNPETGELVPDIITFLDNDLEKTHYHYHRFVFEDGTEIKTVHRHRFYNIEEQMMSHMDLFFVGDHVYKVDGTTTRIISGEEVVEDVRHYTLFSRYQNYFVNGILSGNRFTPYMAIGRDKIKDDEAVLENWGNPVMSQCLVQVAPDVTMLNPSMC